MSMSSPATVAPHVLLVVPWDQTQGGVNTVVRNLARFLTESGRPPLFLFPGTATAPEEGTSRLGFPAIFMNLRTPLVRRRPLRSIVAFVVTTPISLWHLVRLVRARKIDVINVHYPDLDFVHFALLRLLTGVRLVTSVHGADLTSTPKGSLARWWLERLLPASDIIVAPSQEFAQYVRSDVPSIADRVLAISNGIDVQAVRDMASAPELPTGWTPPQGPYCVCVAAFNRKKAHDTLLRAFTRVREPMRLILVGDGPLRTELTQLVDQLGLADRVELAGSQPAPVVAKLFAGAVCSVLPSRDEPFGIAAVESMAVGTPVVASSVGGLREIVTHEETGLLVPPDDEQALAAALTRMSDDAELRARLGRAASQRAQALFDLREFTSRYVDVAYASAELPRNGGKRITPSAPATIQA
jgi:glycosyltransferase involved in cell wall biosynthesis